MTTEPSPKDRYTALDTLAAVRELRAWRGARVDKVYDAGPGAYSLSLRAPGRRTELRIVPGRYAALAPVEGAHAETLSPFARELRRLLTGCAVTGVADPGGERYLEVELARAADAGPTVLAVELFGSGNLLVVRDARIVAVAHPRKWAHRELRIGVEYQRPPIREDPWTMSAERIRAELDRSRTDLATTLAARLALGGPLAEEILARGGWPPAESPSAESAKVAARLAEILRELRDELGEAPQGFLVRHRGVVADAGPFPPARWEGVPDCSVDRLPSFSEAAIAYFAGLTPEEPSPEEKARRSERDALARLAERQRTAAAELRAAAAEHRRDAELVYAHYGEVATALAEAEGSDRPPETVDIVLDDRTVHLRPGHGVEGAARVLYEEAKRLSEKLAGTEEALADTEARIARDEVRERSPVARPTASAAERPKWFEKFRWFVSSEGILVLAGRDAPSNDLLVRRHLKDGDRYVHADLQGAASVVVKRPQGSGSPIGEATLREAAQWAVVFSKAWRAGLVVGGAFWAESEQVSKSAESGEFVPRGAWVVRGTKHFERDLPLEIGVGPVAYEGSTRWTAAPPSALRARGELRVLLVPGEERERSEIEVALARELGLSRPVLQRLLPAGGLSVRRA